MRSNALLLLLPLLLLACGGMAASPAAGPVEARQGDLRVHVATDPAPLRVGQPAFLTISAFDAASGAPLEDVEIRPVVDLYMATSRMLLRYEVIEQTGDGQLLIGIPTDEAGTLKLSVGVKQDGILTPVRMPDIPLQP